MSKTLRRGPVRRRALTRLKKRYPGHALGWRGPALQSTMAALLAGTCLGGVAAQAQDATWAGPGGSWEDNLNWSPQTVPTGTATFAGANPTTIDIGISSIGTLQFNAGAPAYSFNVGQFDVFGDGIINNSANAPSFNVTSHWQFLNESTAGNATITTNSGGVTRFLGISSGDEARFITNAGGAFDISSLTSTGMTAGSIEGAGIISLGAKNLAVGGNNLSTTFSGVLQDGGIGGGIGGSLTKVGTGTLTLSGINTYTGGTIVSGGTLRVSGSIANTASIAVDADGVLQADHAGALGSVRVDLSGGTLRTNFIGTFANEVIFTTVGLSALTAATGTQVTLTGPIALDNNAIAQFGSPADTGTVIIAPGVVASGAAGAVVAGGKLIVDGTLAPAMGLTVNAGATLGGTGTVGDPSITTIINGTLAPGPVGTPGAMTVAGNLAFQSGALYVVQVTPATASQANVIGTATLTGASVQAVFGSGAFIARTYTILSANGGLIGTFGNLTTAGLPAGFAASLSHTGIEVTLNLTAQLGSQPPLPGQQPLPGGGFSINQLNVANALNGFFNGGGTLPPNFVTIFGLTGANLANALTLLSGEAATGAQYGAFKMMDQFLGLMLDPFVDGRSGVGGTNGGGAFGFAPERPEMPDDLVLAYAKVTKAPPAKLPTFDQRWSVWGGGYGAQSETSGDPVVIGSHDLTARNVGFAAGMDYRVVPGTVVGFALAGGGTNWGLTQGLGTGKSDVFQAGVYGATRSGPFFLAASLAYAAHWMSTDRFAVGGNRLSADFDAQSFGARVESGWRIGSSLVAVTPYAAVQWQNFRTPNYREVDVNGLGFGLAYNGRTATDTRSELGARFDQQVRYSRDAVLALRGKLAWAHDWVSDPTLLAGFQALPGASFLVNGATPAQDSALVSAGAELRFANGVTLSGKFDGEFAKSSSTYGGTGTVRYTWQRSAKALTSGHRIFQPDQVRLSMSAAGQLRTCRKLASRSRRRHAVAETKARRCRLPSRSSD